MRFLNSVRSKLYIFSRERKYKIDRIGQHTVKFFFDLYYDLKLDFSLNAEYLINAFAITTVDNHNYSLFYQTVNKAQEN